MGAETEEKANALRDITFGSVAGMVSKVFEHPFDLVKVRLQSQPTDRPASFTGPLDCFKQTYMKEGFRGLYRGLSMPVMGAAAENATLFFVYNKTQDLLVSFNSDHGVSEKVKGKRREVTAAEMAIAAGAAGSAASFILTPIELIKCRMQVQMLAREGALGPTSSMTSTSSSSMASSVAGSSTMTASLHTAAHTPAKPLGPLSLIISTLKTNGVRGLWLGQMGTLFRETGGSAAWFTAYENTSDWFLARRQKLHQSSLDNTETESISHDQLALAQPTPLASTIRPLTKSDLPAYELMLSGAAAGTCYNVILFPADSVKSSIQTWAELHPDKPRLGFWAMANKIWRTRGFKGLYAGCGVTVLRSAPSSAMIFWIYETLQGKFGKYFD